MEKYKRFLNYIFQVDIVDPDDRRRQRILNVLLLSIILPSVYYFISAFTIFISHLYTNSLDQNKIFSPIIIFLFLSLFVFLFILCKKKYFKTVSYFFIGLLLVIASYTAFHWGANAPQGLLAFALLIVMSGILLNAKASIGSFILTATVLFLISYLQINNYIYPQVYWKQNLLDFTDVIMYIVSFSIMSLLSWLYNDEMEKALQRAKRSEHELRTERDMLEIHVQERTEELKKVQMEKIMQIYRFAEFGRLSSGLFHDLVNPLTALSLNLEQMKKADIPQMGESMTYLKQAIATTHKMEDFILMIKKQIASEQNKKIFSPVKEIEQVMQLLDYKFKKMSVQPNLLLEKNISLFGDPIQFDQIAMNLIANAIDSYKDYNADKKIVTIRLRNEKERIVFSVEDIGKGIDADKTDKIFQPFFTTKKYPEGTGIGLYSTKYIVEKNFRGSIEWQSQKNVGTIFIVYFPKDNYEKN